MSLKDGFLEVLGGLTETYTEVVKAENASASPASHNQAGVAVQPTGEPTNTNGAINWLKANWLLLVLVVLALVVATAFIKWVF